MTREAAPPAVLVTGGTRGLGKAIGLEFAKAGSSVYLTHRWGSADEGELCAEFAEQNLPVPRIIESDVSRAEETRVLMETIREEVGTLEVVISNVAFAKTVQQLFWVQPTQMQTIA